MPHRKKGEEELSSSKEQKAWGGEAIVGVEYSFWVGRKEAEWR